VIDAHVHVIPPALAGAVRPVPSMVGETTDPARILEQTRAERVVLSPWVMLLGRAGLNEAMAELRSERVAVLGCAGTAQELRELMAAGFAGVEITARWDGEYLGAERFAPLWAAAEETGALVFVHPSTRGFSGPDEHYLFNTVGNPLETTIAAAHLVTAGVLARHPGLRVLLAHAGGAVLALRGRLAFAARRIPAAGGAPVADSLRRLYYDTITHDPALLRAVVEFAGPEHVLAGSDHPFDMGDPDPAATVRAAGLGATAQSLVLAGNAERLLT
jgi:aminocarboxymuconate-semialdehyde decarboxylase